MKKLFFLLAIIFSVSSASAQKKTNVIEKNGWKINGFAHITGQVDAKDFNTDTKELYNNVLKFRLGFEKSVLPWLNFRMDFQDTRLMGQSPNVVSAGIHNFDLHQGYVEGNNILESGLGFQVGRFQMKYGTERIIGRSLWHMNERRFDGAKIKYRYKTLAVDLFYTRYNNQTPYLLKTLSTQYATFSQVETGNNILGLWTKFKTPRGCEIDVFAINEKNDDPKMDLTRTTLGLNHFGKFGNLKTTLEFAYQLGSTKSKVISSSDSQIDNPKEKDINAYQAAFRLDYTLKPFVLHAGIDMFSGNDPDDPKKIGLFSNTLGSKHKFLGAMDYFLVLSQGTQSLGVNDIFFGGTYSIVPKKFSTTLMAHYFMSNQKNSTDKNVFGTEIDLSFAYKPIKGTVFKAGASVFLQDDLMKQQWGNKADQAYWGYMMVLINI